MEIKEILAKYDTDKETHHGYGDVYKALFSQFDRFDRLNILEVGTQKGGSLLAWKEYFPNSNVVGVDVIDVVPQEYRTDTVTRIVSDIKDIKADKKLDIVIDDGSHYLGDVVYVISEFCTKLNKGGMIIIEDVRKPELLAAIIIELLKEIKLAHPDYSENDVFKVRSFDLRREGRGQSYIMAMIKQ